MLFRSQQTFVYTRNAGTLTATDVGTPTNRIQGFSFGGTTLSLSLNAAPATSDVVDIVNLSYPNTGRTLIQTFTFDGTTLTFTPTDVGTPTTKAVSATYNTSTAALSLNLNNVAPPGMQFSADILYPQGLISRIVHTSVSGAIYVGGTKVQNIISVRKPGTSLDLIVVQTQGLKFVTIEFNANVFEFQVVCLHNFSNDKRLKVSGK